MGIWGVQGWIAYARGVGSMRLDDRVNADSKLGHIDSIIQEMIAAMLANACGPKQSI